MIRWIRRQYWNAQRIIQWIPIIWKDREFDHSYFLQILSFKLEKMEKFYRSKYTTVADALKCAKEIHICKLLCDRLIKNNYHDMLGRKIEMYYDKCLKFKTLDEGHQFGICKNWVHYEDYMQKQDLEYLCKLLQKHLRSWWD